MDSTGWNVLMFGITATAVVAGCLVPNRWLPRLPNDKFLHFASFAVLTLLVLRIPHEPGEAAWWLFGLLMAGCVIECLQALVPDRAFCWRDIAANAAGIGVMALGAELMPAFA